MDFSSYAQMVGFHMKCLIQSLHKIASIYSNRAFRALHACKVVWCQVHKYVNGEMVQKYFRANSMANACTNNCFVFI